MSENSVAADRAAAPLPAVPSSQGRRRAILIALGLMVFVVNANTAAVIPLLPRIGTTYSLTVVETTWVLTTMLLAGGVSTVIIPRLADVAGDRIAVSILVIGQTVGCAFLVFANGFIMLAIGAALLGLAGASGPVAVASLRRSLGDGRLGRAVGVSSGVSLLGTAIGGLASGFAIGLIGLSTFFLLLGVVTLCTAILAVVAIPKGGGEERGSLGVLSVVLVVVWLVAILYGISKGPEWGWGDLKTWAVIGGGVVVAVLWALRERRLATPVIDFSLFKEPAFRRVVFAALAMGLPSAGLQVLIPMITQMDPATADWGLGITPFATALIMLPYPIFGVVGVSLSGLATSRGLSITFAAVGAVMHACGAVWLAFMHDSIAAIVVGVVIYGTGIGLVTAGLSASIQRSVSPARAGMAGGTFSLAVLFSAAIGPVIYGLLLARDSLRTAPGVPTDAMLVQAFLFSACFEVIVLAICASGIRGELRTRWMLKVGLASGEKD